MRALPQLPGAPYEFSYANAASADGSVVVGSSPLGSGERAVRWTSAGVQDLGSVPGLRDPIAYAVSDAGDVVGGLGSGNGPFNLAFVWTPSTGMQLLSDYLAAHGVWVPAGYRLEEVRVVSGDGRTFAGNIRNLSTNEREGFVATVPTPSAMLVLILPAVRRRPRRALV
jgi:uncharacterized membrane protein